MNSIICATVLSVIFLSTLTKSANVQSNFFKIKFSKKITILFCLILKAYTVIYVLDGDTLYVKNDADSTRFKLRILCADAPEKSQAIWGPAGINRLTYIQFLPLSSMVALFLN